MYAYSLTELEGDACSLEGVTDRIERRDVERAHLLGVDVGRVDEEVQHEADGLRK